MSEKILEYKEAVATESSIKDFISLLKPGVMTLVVFTGACGIFLAPGTIHPYIAIITILCIAMASGASGAINMWYDRDIDKIMKRTQNRPIPAGRIVPESALEFGVIIAVFSVLIMAVAVGYVAAILLALATCFYVFIYTVWLKRSTPQNIVIGGAAGAFPPMIGWAAVTGNIAIESVILFLIIFLWTPPHFWALALYRSDDYKLANVPMMPVTHGIDYTKKQIFIYTILMFISTLLPYFIGLSGTLYLTSATILGLKFLLDSYKLLYSDNQKLAPKLFGYSILYLFAIFIALIIDKVI